ncbi:hypothetical protein [Elizabethkingia ursingii]|uniref:hypothetical protein n=1 Tax=Elizabethkingia ursingii TaxID=1756150 RepID=UPI000750C3D3|nr:hypothetical protein [Elizabethkingia ursingii]KUY26062.1 hypothetical protein ATB96_06875 [Elizabethkingia ursingii]
MVFLYTARGAYDKAYDEDGMSWTTYIEWSRLSHLEELVSLDGMLNEVLVEPDQDCKNIKVEGYEFMGYDLLDQDFSISALTNCGGFDETFLPKDLNKKGLITDFVKAYNIKKQLLENNPYEHHADTNVIAVWRHKTIGR